MKIYLILILIILCCNTFYAQILRFNKGKIVITFNTTTSRLEDTLMVYNNGSGILIIDNIYSKNYLAYRSHIYVKDTIIYYPFFAEKGNPLNLTISPDDSAMFVISQPDLCPICKKSPKVNTFKDTLVFKSNSIDTSLSYLGVEGPGTIDVNEKYKIIKNYYLSQNYPNPFNPVTTISFSIPEDQIVELTVYDVLGSEVKELLNEYKKAGTYKEKFEADNLSSGMYFYKLKAGNFVQIKKLILLR